MSARAARVLVADDEASIRFVLREALEEEGCEVVDVDDGDRALEELAAGDFAIGTEDFKEVRRKKRKDQNRRARPPPIPVALRDARAPQES